MIHYGKNNVEFQYLKNWYNDKYLN